MKLHVVYDQQGRIIAASEATQNSLVPQAGAGHTYAELDVPTQLQTLKLQDLVEQVRVDTQARRLVPRV